MSDNHLKVLFVTSGNSAGGINPVVKIQGESFKTNNIHIDFFQIKGRGLSGYLKNIPKLRKFVRRSEYELIHAHYFDSSIVPSLAFTMKPLVVSLMGSDVYFGRFNKPLIRLFNYLFWDKLIVKSEDLKKQVKIKNALIIPNGVNIDRFKPLDSHACKKQLGFDEKKIQVLFLSNPEREEKNYELAKKAVSFISDTNVELKVGYNLENELIPVYLNAADVLVFTSKWEGSPNLIKEAMACNCPIVSTDVGDVKWLFGDFEGHYLSSFDPNEFSGKLKSAIHFAENQKRTSGRNRILELELDSSTVSEKIIHIYKKALEG